MTRRKTATRGWAVRDLIAALGKLNPDALVVLAKDAEGNGFSPLCSASVDTAITEGHYDAHSAWAGDFYIDDGEPGVPAVAFWPEN